ncbi:Hypothetical predicted protein [Mytilus galloprovincialis]|uniref:SET domain-containing protein n=1 Tax=Mytilus galloprovincialis TaxID=29158 RepID=A0A8B6HEB6_MYTGA|nr:Hypothetical predicted protein [Mytilus galloprovincialis]
MKDGGMVARKEELSRKRKKDTGSNHTVDSGQSYKRTRGKKEVVDLAYWAKIHFDPDGFEIRNVPGKGRGVVTTINRMAGDFLLHYAGETISAEEGERREADGPTGFRFFYNFGKKKLCIDATQETGRLGRLVNHGEKRERNAKMRHNEGQLFLISLRDIHFGEEILYDYGVNVVFEKGEKGDTVVGPEGARGIVGPQGENGVAGPVEPMEPSGPPGIPGPGGLTTDGSGDRDGEPRLPGPPGPMGIQGLVSPMGPAEHKGEARIIGTPGIPDLSGTPDTPGVFAGHLSEMIGKPGKDGDPGLQGEPGLPEGSGDCGCEPSLPGIQVPQGPSGKQGIQGTSGVPGIADQQSKLEGPLHANSKTCNKIKWCFVSLQDLTFTGLVKSKKGNHNIESEVEKDDIPLNSSGGHGFAIQGGGTIDLKSDDITESQMLTGNHNIESEEEKDDIPLNSSGGHGFAIQGDGTIDIKSDDITESRMLTGSTLYNKSNHNIESEEEKDDIPLNSSGGHGFAIQGDGTIDLKSDDITESRMLTGNHNIESEEEKDDIPLNSSGGHGFAIQGDGTINLKSDDITESRMLTEQLDSEEEDTYSDIFPALTTQEKTDEYLINIPNCVYSKESVNFVLCPTTGHLISPTGEEQIYEKELTQDVLYSTKKETDGCKLNLTNKESANFILCPTTGHFISPSGEEQIYEKETSDTPFSDEEPLDSGWTSYRLSRPKVKVKRIHKLNGKRQYNKLLACYFCGKVFRHRIKKHLESCHSKETMVASACSKTNKIERRKLFDRIKNFGSFKYNVKILAEGQGNLIVCRRPSKETLNSVDFLPCLYCYGFYGRKELWRHTKKCAFNKNKNKSQLQDASIIARSKLVLAGGLSPYLEEKEIAVPKELEETCFIKMHRDQIFDNIVNDILILQFGKFMISQLGPRRTNYVSQRMRQLARLKLKFNEMNKSEKDLQSLINPEYFDCIITAIQKLAGYHRNEQQIFAFETPSLALNMGHNLVKTAEIKRGNAIRMSDDVMKKESDDFLMLHSSDWTQMISAVALATLRTNKFNKPMALPVTSDLVLLKTYLDSIIEELSSQKFKQQDLKLWKRLAEATLTRIILFNKRRSSEVAKLLTSSFKKRCNWQQNVNEEISIGLKPVEKMLLQRLQMIETQGKQNKRCPVLLTPAMIKAIECLDANKEICKVSLVNPFVFASSTSTDSPISAWSAMNKMATEAGCKNPELISSSRLRKYLATVCQVLDLEDFELEWLSRHLAHNINTHKNHYRQHDSTIEIAKIGNLILAADEGKLGKYAGKKLSDIDVSEFIIPLENEEDDFECDQPAKDEDFLDEDLSDETQVGDYMPDVDIVPANNVQQKPETRSRQSKKKDLKVAVDEFEDNDSEIDKNYQPTENEDESDESEEDEYNSKFKKLNKQKAERRRWTREEQNILKLEFNNFIRMKKIPRNSDALRVKQKHAIFSERSIHQIKSKVQHLIRC